MSSLARRTTNSNCHENAAPRGGIFFDIARWTPQKLRETALPREFEGFDGRATGACGIAVGHHVDRHADLLLALRRHAGTDFVDKPALKFQSCFKSPAAYDQRIGVEGVDHLVEEQP